MDIIRKLIVALSLITVLNFGTKAQTPINYGNSLPATDNLGRVLPDREETGPQKERYVGIFYWIWHDNFSKSKPYIPTEIIKEYPEAKYDPEHSCWPSVGAFWWGEPLWGFYRDVDKWVLSRNAQLLADAGVDVLFFDTTNGSLTFDAQWEVLCETFMELRAKGVNTPKISFLLPFGPSKDARTSIVNLYNKLYKPGKYSDLFFLWEGKPLLMGYPEALNIPDESGKVPQIQKDAKEFFTFRPGQPVYNKGPKRDRHWGWLEIYPQHGFGKTEDGRPEQMTVGVSQNWAKGRLNAMNADGAFGRSYTDKKGFSTDPDDVNEGLNFQEQWDHALKADPQLIFITGWNEWIMGRFKEWEGQVNAFPDQYDQEHSRDIEPMKGGHGDNYYYQMVSNIRRYKGMPDTVPARCKATIAIDGNFSDWASVTATYKDLEGDTMHRNSPGWDGYEYSDNSGRNDIVEMKVADDESNVYFYVACAGNISDCSDNAWMRLFIDTDRKHESGWEGYDFLINRSSPTGGETSIEKSTGKWEWAEKGKASFSVKGREMEIAVPKKALGIKGKNLKLQFKWADNLQNDGDVMDFLISGDCAPIGRYNFSYGE